MPTLADLVEFSRVLRAPEQIVAGEWYVGLEHIQPFGAVQAEHLNDANRPQSAKAAFEAGQLLYGRLRPYLNKVAVATCSGVASTDILVLSVKPPHDSQYVFHLMRSRAFVEFASARSAGANLPRVSAEIVGGFKIEPRDTDAERQIGAILDQVVSLRRRVVAANEIAENLAAMVFLEMFGDPVENPRGWPTKTLGELLSSIDSGWSPVCSELPAQSGQWGVLKLGAVTYGWYDESQNKALSDGFKPRTELEVREGDVLFSRKNSYEHVAACVLVPATRTKLMMSDLIFRLVPAAPATETSPAFLWGAMSCTSKRQQVQALAGGTAGSMPNISKERLRSVSLPVPPMPIQKRFVEALDEVRKLKETLKRSLAETEALYASLSDRYFGAPEVTWPRTSTS